MQAIGQAFHITSDEVLTWDQITRAIGNAAGCEPDIVHISSDFICSFSPEHAGGLIGDKSVSSVFDNSKIKRFVPGYAATVPFSEGIKQSVDWYESNPGLCAADDSFNSLVERIIGAYDKGMKNQT